MEKNKEKKIINGFCFLDKDKVVFVDLVSERTENYNVSFFQKFIDSNKIDEYCIFLANREDGFVTPLYKYKLQTAKSKTPIKCNTKSIDDLITLCYKICIELFKN